MDRTVVKAVYCGPMRLALLILVAWLASSPLVAAQAPPPPPPPAAAKPPPRPAGPPVILISIDGFRADYLTRGHTPTLLRLARTGAWARAGMRPAFPSLTFPNHYTLVTGLTPDHHGIVANSIDDPAVTGDTRFNYNDPDIVGDGRWWSEGEPVWVTAQAAGLRSGTLFWPGSEAEIGGVRPAKYAHYDGDQAPNTRVDMLLNWLDMPLDKRPTFFTLYFNDVDHEGHYFGPASREVNHSLAETDHAIARLLRGLAKRRLRASATLVVVADHGMEDTARDRVAVVDDWGVSPDAVKQTTGGPISSLTPIGPDAAAAEAAILKPHAHVQCWRKADIPARLRYGSNPRIPPILCLAQHGWEVTTRAAAAKLNHFSVGEHGYDPADPDMAALFIAHGPAFKRGYVQPAFDNVDVQPLLIRLLGLEQPPTDGSLASLQGALRRP